MGTITTADGTNGSRLLGDAQQLAAEKHAGQHRKANRDAYIDHADNVAATLAGAGFDEEVIAAGILHDLVEHTDVRQEEIGSRFGERIGALVEAMTDRGDFEPWEARKTEHRERIRAAGRNACAVYGADKLAGLIETRSGYAELGEEVESRLGNPLDVRIKVWSEDLEMLREIEPPIPFIEEISAQLEGLRADRLRASGPDR